MSSDKNFDTSIISFREKRRFLQLYIIMTNIAWIIVSLLNRAFFILSRGVMRDHEDVSREIVDSSETRDDACDVSNIDREPSPTEHIVTFDKQSFPPSPRLQMVIGDCS